MMPRFVDWDAVEKRLADMEAGLIAGDNSAELTRRDDEEMRKAAGRLFLWVFGAVAVFALGVMVGVWYVARAING